LKPLSGQLPGYKGDVSVLVRGGDRKLQCRRRRRSFTCLYDAFAGHYGLVVRDDGRERWNAQCQHRGFMSSPPEWRLHYITHRQKKH
jgi:hypothetical protein